MISSDIRKRFGSWNNALKLIGLDNRGKCARIEKVPGEIIEKNFHVGMYSGEFNVEKYYHFI